MAGMLRGAGRTNHSNFQIGEFVGLASVQDKDDDCQNGQNGFDNHRKLDNGSQCQQNYGKYQTAQVVQKR